MSNFPRGKIEDQLIWLENHATLWQSVEGDVGLAPAQVTQMKALVQEARGKYTDARNARDAAKYATTAQTTALRAARAQASDLVDTIKNFIANTANSEGLWAVAGLNPPAPRGTVPPPNAPTNLSASVDAYGNIVVKWKASQPQGASGTVYSITRAFNNAPTFTLIDVVGGKEFVDSTVPLGTTNVSYIIIAKRAGTSSVPSDRLTIQFGRTGVGSGLTIVGTDLGGQFGKAAA
jgi:hypothetical protein